MTDKPSNKRKKIGKFKRRAAALMDAIKSQESKPVDNSVRHAPANQHIASEKKTSKKEIKVKDSDHQTPINQSEKKKTPMASLLKELHEDWDCGYDFNEKSQGNKQKKDVKTIPFAKPKNHAIVRLDTSRYIHRKVKKKSINLSNIMYPIKISKLKTQFPEDVCNIIDSYLFSHSAMTYIENVVLNCKGKIIGAIELLADVYYIDDTEEDRLSITSCDTCEAPGISSICSKCNIKKNVINNNDVWVLYVLMLDREKYYGDPLIRLHHFVESDQYYNDQSDIIFEFQREITTRMRENYEYFLETFGTDSLFNVLELDFMTLKPHIHSHNWMTNRRKNPLYLRYHERLLELKKNLTEQLSGIDEKINDIESAINFNEDQGVVDDPIDEKKIEAVDTKENISQTYPILIIDQVIEFLPRALCDIVQSYIFSKIGLEYIKKAKTSKNVIGAYEGSYNESFDKFFQEIPYFGYMGPEYKITYLHPSYKVIHQNPKNPESIYVIPKDDKLVLDIFTIEHSVTYGNYIVLKRFPCARENIDDIEYTCNEFMSSCIRSVLLVCTVDEWNQYIKFGAGDLANVLYECNWSYSCNDIYNNYRHVYCRCYGDKYKLNL
jgi:hypothetical protein